MDHAFHACLMCLPLCCRGISPYLTQDRYNFSCEGLELESSQRQRLGQGQGLSLAPQLRRCATGHVPAHILCFSSFPSTPPGRMTLRSRQASRMPAAHSGRSQYVSAFCAFWLATFCPWVVRNSRAGHLTILSKCAHLPCAGFSPHPAAAPGAAIRVIPAAAAQAAPGRRLPGLLLAHPQPAAPGHPRDCPWAGTPSNSVDGPCIFTGPFLWGSLLCFA